MRALSLALVTLLCSCASRAAIPGVFNTGVSDSGALLPPGQVDAHYRMLVTPSGQQARASAYVLDDGKYPLGSGPWLTNGPSSKWIGPAMSPDDHEPGDYRYAIEFDLTGFDEATAVIQGKWTTDNKGRGIYLNGTDVGVTYDGDFSQFSRPFEITSGFRPGKNSLEFVVGNELARRNPTGLRVELTASAELRK